VGATAVRRVIALDGPSGSGKTRLAADLASFLQARGTAVTVIAMDDLYPGWHGLEAGVTRVVQGVLEPFAAGAPEVTLRRWDWAHGREGDWQEVEVADLLIVEGVGCGARACAPYVSLLAWVDGPEPVRRARALARDGQTYAPYWQMWAAQEATHFRREGTRARCQVELVVP
jgi:hypothetical protein